MRLNRPLPQTCLFAALALLGACAPLAGNVPTTPTAAAASPAVAAPLSSATPFLPEGYATATLPPTETPPPSATPTRQPDTLWLSSAVPVALRDAALATGFPPAADPAGAAIVLDVKPASSSDAPTSTWIYALVAPFPTIPDGVTSDELRRAWAGEQAGPFAGRPLWMDQTTLDAFTALWGAPGPTSVHVAPAGELLDGMWADQPSWGIVPFEALQPRWKVLSVDGQSPIHKEFEAAGYPLTVPFLLQPAAFTLPATNRDPSKMTVLVMTGVTALVRATAARMEAKGITYPAEGIGDWLRSADVTHISNEVSFARDCPPPDPNDVGLIFCSNPDYMALLLDVGTDVVELTGNHMNDWGTSNFLYSLDLYRQNNLAVYAGGANLDTAIKPLTLEHNGNKLAFIGCNPVGPATDWATADQPGSAPCGDYTWLTTDVARLRSEGYLPIVTFQYYEYYTPYPSEHQVSNFGQMADNGAVIVSGSQSHYPMTMTFKGNAFIHYGLGNLFFDQMFYTLPDGTNITGTRNEFIDRYIIYDHRVISIELLTAVLEDYARPRPMTDIERAQLLEEIFHASGWR